MVICLQWKKEKVVKNIFWGGNISYQQFFEQVRNLSPCAGHIIQLPKKIVKSWVLLQQLIYGITGKPPVLTLKGADIAFSNYTFSSEKAIRELGYRITPLEEALIKTIQFLKTKDHAKQILLLNNRCQ